MNKIFITKLQLENFQKHTHLILEFVDGVNIIHGASDAGKSCIVRAIKWIFFNEPKGDCIRRENSKKTSVKVWLNNGNVIERIKSDTINAYILNENDKNRYDAIGKTIPEEVKKALGINPLEIDGEEIIVNVANQLSLPFLTDRSGVFRNKLFNKLTGADLLDKAMQSLNSDLLHINKEEKIEQSNLEENKIILEELEHELKNKQAIQKKLSEQFNLLKQKSEQYNKLIDYNEKIDRIELDIFNNQKRIENIKFINEDKITDLDCAIHTLEVLNELLYNIKQNKKDLLELEELNNKVKIPEIDINILKNKIEQLTRLQKIIEQINKIDTVNDNLIISCDNLNVQLKVNTAKYWTLLKEAKVCPTCKQSTEGCKE